MGDQLSERLRRIQLGQELRGAYHDLTLIESIAKIKSNMQPVRGPAISRTLLKLIKARGLLELAFQRGGG